MLVNFYCITNDKQFCLTVGPDITVKELKTLSSKECGISSTAISFIFNSIPLTDDSRTLASYKVCDNDMIVVEAQPTAPSISAPTIPPIDFSNVQVPGRTSQRPPNASRDASMSLFPHSSQTPSIPPIDFSQVQVPGRPSSSRSSQRSNNHMNHGPDNPVAFRKAILENPQRMELIRRIYPPVIEALLSGNEELYMLEFYNFLETIKRQEPLMAADPMDPEVQKKIAEEIQRKNIDENMTMAMQENPESFAQVLMLWINLKVNDHHVKAFVDSGAQMTIMSVECAERCNIMRLVDRRWEGIAKGVGTQKIIGRIHLAQIQIEDVFLQCSFSVLENQPMDVLLGLDMLRRHLCVIDLRENALTIGTNNTKTKFLAEGELPSIGRLHDPSSPGNAGDTPNTSKVNYCCNSRCASNGGKSQSAASLSSQSTAPSAKRKDTECEQESAAKIRKTKSDSNGMNS